MSGLSGKSRRKCLLRSSMLNAVYNSRGLQSLGFLYAIMPGLRDLYPDDGDFAKSCARYSEHFNCHVFWGPFLCGAFLHTEQQISSGVVSEDFVSMLKDTTLNSLSAVGDSFISGSLVVALMLLLSCLVVLNSFHALWIFLLVWLLLALLLKVLGFYLGLARGFALLRQIRQLNLINKGDNLKILNGIMLAAFLAIALGFPPAVEGEGPDFMLVAQSWYLPIGVMVFLSYASTRIHLSRSLAIAAMVVGTSIFF